MWPGSQRRWTWCRSPPGGQHRRRRAGGSMSADLTIAYGATGCNRPAGLARSYSEPVSCRGRVHQAAMQLGAVQRGLSDALSLSLPSWGIACCVPLYDGHKGVQTRSTTSNWRLLSWFELRFSPCMPCVFISLARRVPSHVPHRYDVSASASLRGGGGLDMLVPFVDGVSGASTALYQGKGTRGELLPSSHCAMTAACW